jgi:hypothetical protein
MASGWDPTGVSERGQVSRGGTRELRRANASPGVTSGIGVPSVEGKTPGAGRQRAPLKRAVANTKGHNARRATQGSGAGQGEPNHSETGHWQSERLRVPKVGSHEVQSGQVGNRRPRDPREGRRRRASRGSGGTSGRDSGSTTRLQETPEKCRTGPALSGEGVQHRVSPERPRLSPGSLSPDPSGQGAGDGPSDGAAIGREPGRKPAGLARAVA